MPSPGAVKTYDWVTTEMFEEKLRDIAYEKGTEFLLAIPGVYEAVSEALNNEVLEALEEEREEG